MKPSDLVKVKALEWGPRGSACLGIRQMYRVRRNRSFNCWVAKWDGEWQYKLFITESAAKAACQAHYESMVLSLLEVK